MFGYLLSVAIAFIVFGTVFNIVRKIAPTWYDNDYNGECWFVVTAFSFCFVTLFKLIDNNACNLISQQF